jgi:hypothetical protein
MKVCFVQAGEDGSWHNPIAPVGYTAEVQDTRPICEFYSKIGVCRFRDRLVVSDGICCSLSCIASGELTNAET